MRNHFNTPKESKHLSFSFCAPRLLIVNWRLKYYFLFLGEENSVSVQCLEPGGWASPSNDQMIPPCLTPHYLLHTTPNPVICITPWILLPKNICTGTSLVAQWLRIRLPMQGTRVWALVWEDPTCRGAPKPVHHNYWACALEPGRRNYWAHEPQLLKPTRLEPVLRNKRSHRNEKPVHRNEE